MRDLIITSTGVFPAVTFHGGHLIVSFGDAPTNQLAVHRYDPDTLALVAQQFIPMGFARSDAHIDGPWLAYRTSDERGNLAALWNLDEGRLVALGERCDGNPPVMVGAGYWAWQRAAAGFPVFLAPLGNPAAWTMVRNGAPTGLSRILPDGTVRLIDEDRNAMLGGTMPAFAGDLSVDEHPDSGLICRLTDGRELRLWAGQETRTPRCAVDGQGRRAVVTWGGPTNVRVAVLADGDFTVPTHADPTDYGPPLERPIWYGWYKVLNTATDGSQGSCYHAERVGLVRLSDGALIARPADGEGLLWRTPAGETWQGGQAYLDAPGPATVSETRAMLRAKIDQIVNEWAGAPGVLVPQAYDRGGAWKNQETLVGMQVEYLDACRRHENIVALVPFALDRLGGANAYPALRAAWDQIGQRLHPPELPAVSSPAIKPPGITVDSYGSTLTPGGDWSVKFHDRNGTGMLSAEIRIHMQLLTIFARNAAGDDTTGTVRIVKVTP